MCWNWQVSVGTWLIAVVASLVLLRRRRPNDLTLALVLLTYSSIQFWEFLLWIDQDCGSVNRFATYAVYLALYAHALAFGVGIYLEQGKWLPLVIGLGFMVVAGVLFSRQTWTCSRPKEACRHLTWGFSTNYYVFVFFTCMILAFVYIRPLRLSVSVFGMFFLSWILPKLLVPRSGVDSMWCFIAALAGPIFIVLNETSSSSRLD